jgi:hypothetical protein
VSARQLATALTRRNFSGFTLADVAENTETILTDKVKYQLDNLPDYLRPTQKYNSIREIHFQKPDATGLNSKIRVSTAQSKEVGRSKTVNFFHGSEVAFWSDLKKIMKGLGQALTKNCVTILETTANGFNAYKELWDDSENTWEKLFFEWWLTGEYRLPFESEARRKAFLKAVAGSHSVENADAEQWALWRIKMLMEEQTIDEEQAYWFYDKWSDLKGDIRQEYPCTPEEAFLATGQNYFSVANLDERLKYLRKLEKTNDNILAQGYFEYSYTTDRFTKNKIIDPDTIGWVDSAAGDTKIYIESNPKIPYIIGADTATDGTNNNLGQVIDRVGRQQATIVIAKDEDLFAEQLFCLGWYYNNALIVPEINHSTHPTKVLVERGYPNVYVRGISDSPVDMSDHVLPKYGFRTDANNRPSMLGLLRQIVRDTPEYINDIDTIKEMLTFIRNKVGKPEAEASENDDRVLAYAIALQVAESAPEELRQPLAKLEGFYTESELEDMGYSKYEISGYLSGRMTLYREEKL